MGVDPGAVGLLMARIDVRTTDPQGLIESFQGCPLFVNALLTLGRTDVSLLMVGESVGALEALVDIHIRPLASVQEVDLHIVTRVAHPLLLPSAIVTPRCDLTVCGFHCARCRYYGDGLCPGCPASAFYKGKFWRG